LGETGGKMLLFIHPRADSSSHHLPRIAAAAYVVALTGTGVGVRGRDRRVGSSLIFFLESLAPCPVSASARVPITSSIAAPFLLRSTTVAYYKTKKSRKIPLSWPQQLAAIDR
jgi:hypothetical protein